MQVKTDYTWKAGFTFIEMLVVIGIFGVVMATIVSSAVYFYRTNAHVLEQIYAVDNARKGVEFLVRDVREAGFADNGAYPVILIEENEILFYSDVDRDDSVERIRYRLNNENLEKGVTNATGSPAEYQDIDEVFSVVTSDVRNNAEGVSMFSYFDSSGTEVTDFNNVTDVVFVRVNLIININPLRLPENFTLRSSATIRDLKTNL